MSKKYVPYIIMLIIILIGILFIITLEKNMLKINTLSAIKTDLFKSKDDDEIYYEYIDTFEKYILAGNYQNAYQLLNEYNAEEKFEGLTDFENKMSKFYSQNQDINYSITDIVDKATYKDIYFKATIMDENYNYNVVQLMIREKSIFDYEIYFLTEI